MISSNIIQIQPFYEVDTSLCRPKRCISTENVVRGRYNISRSICNLYRLNRKAVFFIFVQYPSHIFYIINCHAKHETEDLQMDIHPGLGVLATGN